MPASPPFPGHASGNGLLNLVQSIAQACGGPRRYPELTALTASTLGQARHVVLLIADGLGQSLLDTLPPDSALRRHWRATLTSVFPSTTAAAITTCLSGLAPAAHGLIGWHVQQGSPARTLAVLPLTAREAQRSPGQEELPALLPELFPYPTLFQQLARPSWVLSPRSIAFSPFNRWHARGATIQAHDGIDDLVEQIVKRLSEAREARYIYAYYPDLDSLAHRHGWRSAEVAAALSALDAAFARLVEQTQGLDTGLVLTADHGFIDAPPEHHISLDDHPDLAALLAHPLSGEQRVAYAHLKAGSQATFAHYVRAHLADGIDLYQSGDLIDAGCFGPPPHHPQLRQRAGDYTLVMRENWTIKDWLPNEKRYRLIGVHGGTSPEEMRIPLIAVGV